MQYQEFLDSKASTIQATGFKPDHLNPNLFLFQRDIVEWALQLGKAAIFAGCGLGKSCCMLSWADAIVDHTGGKVLIVAPLSVTTQTHNEGIKFGVTTRVTKTGEILDTDRIVVTNYQSLHKFSAVDFVGVVLDEASIIKSIAGSTKEQIIEMFAHTQYKLACTATPSPNDYMELGNQASFLGVCSSTEMLATYFTHDGGDTSKWRLKGHAKREFWKWVSQWAVTIEKPSDIGYSDDGYDLPPIEYHEHVVDVVMAPDDGQLFKLEASDLMDRRRSRRNSIDDRVAKCAELVNNSNEQWLIWCDLNDEGDLLESVIDGAIQIAGKHSDDQKEDRINWFLGNKCLCQEKSSHTLKSKKNGIENTTETTEKEFSPIKSKVTNYNLMSNEKPESNTWLNTSKTTNLEKELEKNEIELTQQKEKSTKQTRNTETKSKQRLTNTPLQVLNTEANCGSMDSLQNVTTQCLHNNLADVQYAEGSLVEINDIQKEKVSTSIIVTKQELSEDYCVPNATSDLENSKTIQNHSNEQQCTCGYLSGKKVLISKAMMIGHGLNLQNCHNIAFVGMSDSYEQLYQAIRRCWRFGQTEQVHVHFITASSDGAVVRNIKRKEKDMEVMIKAMIKEVSIGQDLKPTANETIDYATDKASGNGWDLYRGDCVDMVSKLANNSIDFSCYSPPFSSLYVYSNSIRDMGNSKSDEEFYRHYRYLMAEMFRVIKPGRLMSFHCMNLPMSKQHDGVIGLKDFRGDLIRICQDAGFVYHSEVVIWKNPVTAMQRTKAIGLLHKQVKKDSAMSRQGIPDYLVTMRKPGVNLEPIEGKLDKFAGEDGHGLPTETIENPTDRDSINIWQRYASPVWMDVDQSRTLQHRSARADEDERHICPTQLDVIERAMQLWSNPGDVVLSPFCGIGTEGYVALEMGRKYIGVELKESYYDQARLNLEIAASKKNQLSLFDL